MINNATVKISIIHCNYRYMFGCCFFGANVYALDLVCHQGPTPADVVGVG